MGTVDLTGPIGWLKTQFTLITHANGQSTWGSGAITDGTYKLNIHVTHFTETIIEKGTKIEVKGTIKSTEPPITLHCMNMDCIKIIEDSPKMLEKELRRGVRTPRPLVTLTDNNAEKAAKKLNLEVKDQLTESLAVKETNL